ncbi:MAG: CorA family divalent cation transporter [bacterium]|nr:CorA family divalent cation transporter [bacterium]
MHSNFIKSGFPFVWKDVYNPNQLLLESLAKEHNLPTAAVIDCMQAEHLPKFETFENYHFIIARFYDSNCAADSDNIHKLTRKIAFFYNNDFLLTVHRSETPFINKVAEKYANDKAFKHPFDLTCKLIKNALETFEVPIEKMEKEIDLYENKIFLKKKVPDLLRHLYLVKRRTSVFKKLNNISKMVVETMHVSHRRNPFYEDMRDYYLRIETDTDDLHENIGHLLNLYISLASQKTNDVMRILTVFAAFFLPLTFIVGVYGMNFEYMPELASKWGYPGVIILMALVTALIFQWFKRKNWL